MIVRTTDEITGTDRQVSGDTWTSKRIILSDDEVGFSFHETTVQAGTETPLHYPDYIEAVWLIEGHGELINREDSTTHPLAPGTMYLLDGQFPEGVSLTNRFDVATVSTPGGRTHQLWNRRTTDR